MAWLIPLLGVLLGLFGVVLSAVSLRRARTGLSVAGVVLGVLAVVVAIVFWIAYARQIGTD